MADFNAIRSEIKASFKRQPNSEQIRKIDLELDLLELTEGLKGKNNLETFYNIWTKHKTEIGNLNEIHSWTAYCLGMTDIEPTADFLPTRRAFARSGFPDIDTDFDDERRDEVYGYLIEKYGRENVGNIGTYQKQKMKAAVRNSAKALDSAYAFHLGPKECKARNSALANEISKSLPVLNTGLIRVKDEKGNELTVKTLEAAYKHVPDFAAYMDKYPEILHHAKNIEGLAGSFSQHAAGVVISNVPLRTIAPLRANKKGLATAFPYEDLELIGLIKFDILAITTLTVIRDCLKLVKDAYGIDIDVTNIPLDDEKTLELYRRGALTGVFQCENYGMQNTMRDIGVDSFDDIMAAIALYRPGPMAFIPDYCQRKKGLQKVNYFHPAIEKLVKKHLSRTYGITVYQEQLMQIAESMAGFSVTEGYVMIKAVSKKKQEILDKYLNLFIEGATKRGVPKHYVEMYWNDVILPFASYGFNASHAACYALLSYTTAYLKANYPDEYVCSFLNVWARNAMNKNANKWDVVHRMEADASRVSGIKILPRNLNECGLEFKIVRRRDPSMGIKQTEIQPPLCCKGLGYESAKNIVENGPLNGKQPYAGPEDLASRTDTAAVTAESIAALCDNGYIKGKTGQKNKDAIIEKFITIREDLKTAQRKGVISCDIFG